MNNKPNCYNCKYRGGVPGSAHSQCHHPAFKQILDDPMGQLLSIMGKRAGNIQITSDKIKVIGDQYGISQGWFNHPFNFDPTWLESCTGFEAKESK